MLRLLSGFVIAALLASCDSLPWNKSPQAPAGVKRAKLQKAPPPPPFDPLVIDRSRPTKDLLRMSFSELPSAAEAAHRLLPDRRFLHAVRDVYEINTERRNVAVEIDFTDGSWLVRCDGKDVGQLPEIPSFQDGLKFLSQWATATRPGQPEPVDSAVLRAAEEQITRFYPRHLTAALKRIDESAAGKTLDARSQRVVTHAVVMLTTQMYDFVGIGDALRSRALANLALSSSLDSSSSRADEAIMAWLLGYENEARVLLKSANDDGYAAAYIGITEPSAWPAETKFDWLRSAQEFRAGHTPRSTSLDVQAIQLATQENRFDWETTAGHLVQAAIAREVATRSGQGVIARDTGDGYFGIPEMEKSSRVLLGDFESDIDAYALSLSSRFLGRESVQKYYEANFYSGLTREFWFHAYSRGDLGGSRSFLQDLGLARTPTGKQVTEWMAMEMATDLEGGRNIIADAVVHNIPLVGGVKRAALYKGLMRAKGANGVRPAAGALLSRLDTRPREMYAAGQIAAQVIGDPLLRDRYINEAAARASVGNNDELAWYYFRTGNQEKLRAMAGNRALHVSDRGSALDYLAQLGDEDRAYVEQTFSELFESSGDKGLYTSYAGYLNRTVQWKVKEAKVRWWLAKNAGDDTVDPIAVAYFASSLANALEQQGRYREAYDVIKPHIPVWNASIIIRATSLLQRLGRNREAIDLGRRMVERYPSAGVRAEFAAVLWRMKRYDEAAALFDPRTEHYDFQGFITDVPEKFIETLAEADQADAIAAWSALIALPIDSERLISFPKKAMEQNRHDLAFALADRLSRHPDYDRQFRNPQAFAVLALGYRALVKTRGEVMATTWLINHVPESTAAQAVMNMYDFRELEAGVKIGFAFPATLKDIQLQALLASVVVEMRMDPNDARWRALAEEVARHSDSEDSLVIVAKYLLGLVDERTYVASLKSPNDVVTAAYFTGVKAALRGENERAHRLIFAATCGPGYPPTYWAQGTLTRWVSIQKQWFEIVREHLI